MSRKLPPPSPAVPAWGFAAFLFAFVPSAAPASASSQDGDAAPPPADEPAEPADVAAQEEAVPAPDLALQMQQASVPSFGFFFMLALAAAIATFGLCLPTLWRVEEVCTSSLRIRQLVSMPYRSIVVSGKLPSSSSPMAPIA